MDDLSQLPKDLQKIKKELDKAKEKCYTNIGKKLQIKIKARWKAGKGVNNNGESVVDLEALKPSTVIKREYMKKNGKLHKDAKPDFSNLIATGKTYDSLKYETDKDGVTIGAFGREEIIKINEESNAKRTIMHLSKDEQKFVDEEIERMIDKVLSNL